MCATRGTMKFPWVFKKEKKYFYLKESRNSDRIDLAEWIGF